MALAHSATNTKGGAEMHEGSVSRALAPENSKTVPFQQTILRYYHEFVIHKTYLRIIEVAVGSEMRKRNATQRNATQAKERDAGQVT